MAQPEFNETLFRQQFPAFADPVAYPSATLQMYWDEVGCWIEDGGSCGMLSGNCTVLAMSMLLAHFLELAKLNKSKGTSKQGGFKSGATVDKVSVQYLAPPNQDQFTWWLNQTNYGMQLGSFLEMKAVGGTFIGGLPERTGFRKVRGGFR